MREAAFYFALVVPQRLLSLHCRKYNNLIRHVNFQERAILTWKNMVGNWGCAKRSFFFCFQYAGPLQVVVLACASVVFYFPRQRPSRSEVAAFQAEVVDLIRSYYPSIWEAHLIQGTQLVFHPIWHLFGYVWILICSTLFLPQKLPCSTAWGSVGSRLERWRSQKTPSGIGRGTFAKPTCFPAHKARCLAGLPMSDRVEERKNRGDTLGVAVHFVDLSKLFQIHSEQFSICRFGMNVAHVWFFNAQWLKTCAQPTNANYPKFVQSMSASYFYHPILFLFAGSCIQRCGDCDQCFFLVLWCYYYYS